MRAGGRPPNAPLSTRQVVLGSPSLPAKLTPSARRTGRRALEFTLEQPTSNDSIIAAGRYFMAKALSSDVLADSKQIGYRKPAKLKKSKVAIPCKLGAPVQ